MVSTEIHDFLEELHRESYQDVFRIYQIYDHMLCRMQGYEDVNQLKPNTWLYRIKKIGEQMVNLGQRLAGVVIIIIGMAVAIYLICHPIQEEAEPYPFEWIGTLKIDGDGTYEDMEK